MLRRKGFTIPILVLGGVLFRQIGRFINNNLDITVSSLELAYAVNKTAKRYNKQANVHIKFDTGLNRIGINHKNASKVFERIKPLKNLNVMGIYSHFSTSDEPNPTFTNLQLERFKQIIKSAEDYAIGYNISTSHVPELSTSILIPS